MESKNKKLDDFFQIKSNGKTSAGKRKAETNEEDEVNLGSKKIKEFVNKVTKEDKEVDGEEAKQSENEIKTNVDTPITLGSNIENSSVSVGSSAGLAKTSLASIEGFIGGLGSWRKPLGKFAEGSQMQAIYKFVAKEYKTHTVYPPEELIFNAFAHTTWDNLKVVIIGQDPYPGAGQAMGLSFSVNRGIAVPKSLVNIYKCLENDKKLQFTSPKHGDLSSWADKGVFLLNATLTVIAGSANSHQMTSGWQTFTDHVIKTISEQKQGIVFLLWGNFAIKKKKLIDSKKHHVIECIHPSPLAQTKGDFTKSDQFSKTNEYLQQEGKKPIDWNLPK